MKQKRERFEIKSLKGDKEAKINTGKYVGRQR